MITVEATLVPHGDQRLARPIASFKVWNDGGTEEVGDYVAELTLKMPPEPVRHWTAKGIKRDMRPWDLVAKMAATQPALADNPGNWPPQAREAVLRYGQHAPDCAFHMMLIGCSCGWKATKIALLAARAT